MIKIRELQVGQNVVVTMVVKSSDIKLTKAKKPYLMATLFDGADNIQANYWDYDDELPIAPNTIVTTNVTVGEYMGKKQLTIKSLDVNTDVQLSDFMPKGNISVKDYVLKAKELIDSIDNEELQTLVRTIFNDNRQLWNTVPGAKGVHHAYTAGTLQHSVDTALKAKAIAELTPNVNVSLCISGALLHDLGKLWTYEVDGVNINMTFDGCLYDHIAIGLVTLDKYTTPSNAGMISLLKHIIASHHGKLEYGSPVTPAFMEAIIVNFADELDAKLQIAIEANGKAADTAVFTDKIWALENRALVTQKRVAEMMIGYEEE